MAPVVMVGAAAARSGSCFQVYALWIWFSMHAWRPMHDIGTPRTPRSLFVLTHVTTPHHLAPSPVPHPHARNSHMHTHTHTHTHLAAELLGKKLMADAKQKALKLKNAFHVEMMKIPSKIKKMPWKQFVEEYQGSMDNVFAKQMKVRRARGRGRSTGRASCCTRVRSSVVCGNHAK